jgi:hypothetical protein
MPLESRFIVELYKGPQVEVDGFLSELAAHPRFKTWELPVARVAEEIGAREEIPYPEAIEAAYTAYARSRGKARWGDKTPRYVEDIPFLAKLFPSTKFIHIIRDGRNVALSYSNVDFGPKTLAKAARLWRRRVSAGIRDGRALPPGRYFEIRSEDLAEDPEGEARDICEFLGIEYAPSMFEDSERKKGVKKQAKLNYEPQVAGRARMSSWKEDMRPQDVEVFEVIAGDLLSELGYERRFPRPSVGARAKAKLALAGVPLARLK